MAIFSAGCFLYESWEAIVVGMVGATLTCSSMPLMDFMKVDDPVGATSVHGNFSFDFHWKW